MTVKIFVSTYLLRICIVYACICLYFYCMQNVIMFPSPPPSYELNARHQHIELATGESIVVDLRRVYNEHAGNKNISKIGESNIAKKSVEVNKGIKLPAENAAFIILYSYGNAEDLGLSAWRLEQLRELGVDTCAYDYPGYGHSSGSPSPKNLCASIEAVYHWLIDNQAYRPEQIIIYGRSVGSGPSGYLAAQHPHAGLILECGMMSAQRIITPLRFLPWDEFTNINLIPRIQTPMLFIHGQQDRTIAFGHGQALYAASGNRGQHCWLDDCGHNDIDLADSRIQQALQDFLAKLKH
ncbi:MAG: alpha/beta hydrolase [Planctomycetes bacterium]|nr:alpha/beta hydrolase [Planctomycetota bacterium]